MGVHGLTTYLRENKRLLSKTLEFPVKNGPKTSVVVDGWSFIYDLHHNSNLPWVYGGEYEAFSKLVVTVVRAWISAGLKLYFVFDGPYPPLKFSTLVSRLGQSHVQPSLLFFRTSAASRATPRFLNENRIIPPLCYSTCIHSLQNVASETDALEIHYADEEGDPYAVELAGRVGGYVVGLDSDFVVLNSDGYMGYIPLDEMIWNTPLQPDASPEDDDRGFQPVRKSKGMKRPVRDSKQGRGIIPPEVDNPNDLTLTVTVYHPSVLASHLNLPVTLLPLLGALVGNDFSNQTSATQRNVQVMFFERQLNLSQRITRVATTLQTILAASSQKRKQKQQVGSVMDLIDRAVNALLIRSPSTMGSGEIDTIVEKIVEAALQYAIPKYEGETQGQDGLWSSEMCALHQPDVCPLIPSFSRLLAANTEIDEQDVSQKEQVRSLYISAYRTGQLAPKILDIVSTGTYWSRLFLENPDFESVGRSIGRPIREWVYAILEDGVGLVEQVDEEENEGSEEDEGPGDEEQEDEDEDELIDVVEDPDSDDDDLLAPLRGQLQRLHSSDGETDVDADSPPSSSQVHSSRPTRPKGVVEYVRRGTRVAPEEVLVPTISELPSNPELANGDPVQLKPEDDRLSVLFHILHSNTSAVSTLSQDQLLVALALRWVVWILHRRAQENVGSKEKEKERWTKNEARAYLASFSWSEGPGTSVSEQDVPPIDDRNIQLMAQVAAAMESVEHLSQILLLTHRVPSPMHLFSGKKFHALLTGVKSMGANEVPSALWDACTQGLDMAFAEERRKKGKKGSTEQNAVNSNSRNAMKGTYRHSPAGGLYGLLTDMEA